MILESLSILGDRYVETLRRGLLEERWADVEPREHKESSQFSAGSYGTKPFLMTSYNGSVIDVSTLAHEAGHSVHTHLTNESQPACYFDYVMIVAETASNLNQVLLREHIFAKGDRELSLAALDDAFCFMHRYLFLMPILSSIERRTHDEYSAGRSVSLDDLCGWTSEAFTNGYGPAVNCDQVRIGIKWAEFSHLYDPGYLFQYIVGLSAALDLGKRLRAGEPGLPERIEEFLRAGASMPPSDIFKIVGIDISSPALYRAAFEEVKRLNQILESLITRP
jgi:oligoendopeptidase F